MSGRKPVVPNGSPVAVRFRALVDTSGGPNACWPWKRSTDREGYGKFQINGRTVRASRFALEQSLGRKLEPGEEALHHCDNPGCCRVGPEHIFLGTQADNMADKVAKGRQATGMAHGRAAYSDATLARIRTLLAVGERQCDVAQAVGVPRYYVCAVAHNRARRAGRT